MREALDELIDESRARLMPTGSTLPLCNIFQTKDEVVVQLAVPGFKKDDIDLAEDYSLWLRLGKVGKMYNFQEPFTLYSKTVYNKEKLLKFYQKQLWSISENRESYSYYTLAYLLLKLRMVYEKIF